MIYLRNHDWHQCFVNLEDKSWADLALAALPTTAQPPVANPLIPAITVGRRCLVLLEAITPRNREEDKMNPQGADSLELGNGNTVIDPQVLQGPYPAISICDLSDRRRLRIDSSAGEMHRPGDKAAWS
jgi:hypothetical protein